jgi:hypothetical protein
VTLGSEGNVENAFFRLREPSAHGKSDALKGHMALTEHKSQMLLFFPDECGRPHDRYPTRHQHRLSIALSKGLEALNKL